jgi:large subunit ribosomal protein L10e
VSRKWGFTKFVRVDYVKWKEENRLVNDGVTAKLLGSLAQRPAGRAFIDAAIATLRRVTLRCVGGGVHAW